MWWDILVSLATATIAALLAFSLSLTQFRSERWWELKIAAYQRIIEALYNEKMFLSHQLDTHMGEREHKEEEEVKLKKRAADASEEILKVINVGKFLLSDASIERLAQYQTASKNALNEETWFDYLNADWEATDNCLTDLMKLAKRDLAASSVNWFKRKH